MKQRICIIAEDYPTEGRPSYPFVQELAYGLSNVEFECTVIAPQSITSAIIHREKLRKRVSKDVSPENHSISIYRPYIITFSNSKNNILNKLTCYLFERAILRVLRKTVKMDCVYCYFWHIGLIAAKALKHYDAKIFVQASECDIDVIPSYVTETNLNRINGVVCASRKNFDESKAAGFIGEKSKAVIIPNGFRKEEFHPIEKRDARNKLGIDEKHFIIVFVGDFNERKGTARLSKAIDQFDDVYSLFIGKGNVIPTCKNILFQGLVPHKELATYLNCADIFVLPTQAEGCCNAIIEAVACGLPVVSSQKSFNDEILDESYSIRIDESSIAEIAEAIRFLKDNKETRIEMSKNALAASEQFPISRRAEKISSFILSAGNYTISPEEM